MEPASHSLPLEWGVAAQAAPGETLSGDLHVVAPHSRGCLLAVIDGSGHGPAAAAAATLAADTLRLQPADSITTQLSRCHLALAGTRGAVVTLAGYNERERTLTLGGVGNVEATLFRAAPLPGRAAQENAPLRGGVVGDQLPPVYATILAVNPGDVLVMASDGLRTDFQRDHVLRCPPALAADKILGQYTKGNDDALVLVVRFPS